MIRIAIAGAAGRMGKRLIALTLADADLQLAAAVDHPACGSIGSDAGINAGAAECGVMLTTDVAAAAAAADVLIDFSVAKAVAGHAAAAAAQNCALVIGTTGMPDETRASLQQLADAGARIVQAPNMSVGVNVLFRLCAEAARILGDAYDIEVVEMHHNQKQDAPSGTAVRLGEILAEARDLDYANDTRHGRHGMVGKRRPTEIGMHALRGGDVVGDHTVIFAAAGERIELTHKASSRDTFAGGALRAARFIVDAAPGLYDMQAVLGLRD